MNAPSRPDESASFLLAAALVAMPFLQFLPIDFDRTGVLCLTLPFLWSGRSLLESALTRIWQTFGWFSGCLLIFFAVAAGSAMAAGPQFAPALVTTACWVLFAATALIAGELVARAPATGARLLGALALSTLAGIVVVWVLWWIGGRGPVPLYAHYRIFGLHTISGAVAAIALIIQSWDSPRRRYGWFAVGAVNWAGLLWSGGRAPMVALVLPLAAWWLVGNATLRRRLAGSGAGLLIAGLLLSLVMWTPRPELGWWNALHRTTSANVGPALSVSAITSTRSDFWRESLDRVQLRPWLGHGADAYRHLTPKLDGQQPHNFILQLLLDVGVIGTGAALLFLSALLLKAVRRAVAERGLGTTAPWLALVLACLIAGLLDGVFYHLVALLPATIALGTLAATSSNPEKKPRRNRTDRIVATISVGLAAAILGLHTWLFYSLAVAPVPERASSRSARLVRAFPSTTFGLWRWLDEWQSTDPPAALDWSRWAETHSANPPSFHIYTARLLLARGDRDGGLQELRAAFAEAHRLNQPAIAEMIRTVESAPR
ncbi:MAG: O-antigen ligase family protein [Lacunisphaera sp.]